jgi:hypothetical protein
MNMKLSIPRNKQVQPDGLLPTNVVLFPKEPEANSFNCKMIFAVVLRYWIDGKEIQSVAFSKHLSGDTASTFSAISSVISNIHNTCAKYKTSALMLTVKGILIDFSTGSTFSLFAASLGGEGIRELDAAFEPLRYKPLAIGGKQNAS